MTRYFVGIGSNLGDRLARLRSAIAGLAVVPGVELGARSGIWETRPLGPGSGPFLNAAIELWTKHDASAVLEHLLAIEARHGRVRRVRWGDRSLDLDLLCGFDEAGTELVVETSGLKLPHPRMAERDFVLQPLVDIDDRLIVGGQPCSARLERLSEDQRTVLRRLVDPL